MALSPTVCMAKTSEAQKKIWAEARKSGEMTQSEEDVIRLLTYEHLTGLEGTATGGELSNIFHKACQDASDLLVSRLKVDSRKAIAAELFSVLDDALTNLNTKHPACIFGKGLYAQAARNLSGLKFTKSGPKAADADDGDEVVEEVL